jgi:hypothetical protein
MSLLAVFLDSYAVGSWHAHFANELTAECVDDTSNRGLLALADKVKIEHALHGTGLQSAVDTLLEVPFLNW